MTRRAVLFNSAIAAALFSAGLLFALLRATSGTPAPRTYYVSTDGKDSNSGSAESPWKTIQKAANALKAGETVIINAGNYDERVQIRTSGTADAPIALIASGRVSCQGFNVSGSFIKIDGFEIVKTPGNDLYNRELSSGIYSSGNGNVFTKTNIRGTNAAGIYLTSQSKHNAITSNVVFSAVEAGIYVQGSDHVVESNDISHTVQTHPGMLNAADADGIRFFGSGSIFRKNYIHDITLSDSGNKNPHIDAFQTWGPASHIIIEQNRILQMESPNQGITMEGINQPVGGIVIRNNIFMTRGTEYAPAVLAGDRGRVNDIDIVNNTMVALNGPAEYAIWLFSQVSTVRVNNNAIHDHGHKNQSYIRIDPGATDVTVANNAISKSDREPPGKPYPRDLWMVNPQFINFAGLDFRVSATSPLVDAGALLKMVPNDFDNKERPRGRAMDIGAFER